MVGQAGGGQRRPRRLTGRLVGVRGQDQGGVVLGRERPGAGQQEVDLGEPTVGIEVEVRADGRDPDCSDRHDRGRHSPVLGQRRRGQRIRHSGDDLGPHGHADQVACRGSPAAGCVEHPGLAQERRTARPPAEAARRLLCEQDVGPQRCQHPDKTGPVVGHLVQVVRDDTKDLGRCHAAHPSQPGVRIRAAREWPGPATRSAGPGRSRSPCRGEEWRVSWSAGPRPGSPCRPGR